MSIRIRVDTKDIQDYLDQTLQNIKGVPKVCKNALRAGMMLARDLAQVYAPVDTGRLRDSIHLEESGEGGLALVADPINDNAYEYAVYPEYGWGQPEQPYIRPALEEGIQEAVNRAEMAITGMFVKDYFIRQGRLYEIVREIETGKIAGGGYV